MTDYVAIQTAAGAEIVIDVEANEGVGYLDSGDDSNANEVIEEVRRKIIGRNCLIDTSGEMVFVEAAQVFAYRYRREA